MNSKEFEQTTIDLEKRLHKASKSYHKCIGIVLEKYLRKDVGYEDVTLHCVVQK
jgi:hypothetical protein